MKLGGLLARLRSMAESREQAPDEKGTPKVQARLLMLEDVAAYLSVSVPQVYALVRSGDLPGIKLGGRGVWRVDREQLEAYIQRLQNETDTWTKEHPLNPP